MFGKERTTSWSFAYKCAKSINESLPRLEKKLIMVSDYHSSHLIQSEIIQIIKRTADDLMQVEAKIEQWQDGTPDAAWLQAPDESNSKELIGEEQPEETSTHEPDMNLAMETQTDRALALEALKSIQDAMMETQKNIRQLGPDFSRVLERVNGGFVAEGLRNLIRCTRTLRQAATVEGDYYAEELEQILAQDFGCEKITPLTGSSFESESMRWLNADLDAMESTVQAMI